MPLSKSFLCVKPDNILLSSLKLSEDGESFILRIYEAHGKDTNAEIILPFKPVEVYRVNLLENEIEKILVNSNIIRIFIPKNKVLTLKISKK